MGASKERSIVITMAFDTMTPPSVTSLNLARSTFSRRTVRFVKDAKKCAKKCSLTDREVKDLNALVKDKIKETIKERNCDMHAMSNFEDLSIFSSNDSIESIISDTSDEELDVNSCKPAHKK
eukprot:8362498-Ditylum_brightwellii.AAC.1